MINLQDYLFNDVILTDIDNKQWKGHVFSFHDADDNEDNENSITLKIPDNKNLIEFTESEIKSIKIA
ncbi:MAG: hypothetical protein E7508_10910 [Ruminococcus sp.]|nr:hypothetical protein [Ruminococcus sp.]